MIAGMRAIEEPGRIAGIALGAHNFAFFNLLARFDTHLLHVSINGDNRAAIGQFVPNSHPIAVGVAAKAGSLDLAVVNCRERRPGRRGNVIAVVEAVPHGPKPGVAVALSEPAAFHWP